MQKSKVYKLIPSDLEQMNINALANFLNELRVSLNQLLVSINEVDFKKSNKVSEIFSFNKSSSSSENYFFKFYSLGEVIFLETNFQETLNFSNIQLVEVEYSGEANQLIIGDEIANGDAILGEDFVNINGMYMRLINLYEFSKNLMPSALMDYGDYCVFFRKLDPLISKRRVNTQRKLHYSNLYSNIRNIESEASFVEAEKITEAMMEGVENLFEVEAWFILKSDTQEDLNNKTKELVGFLKQAEFTPYIEAEGLYEIGTNLPTEKLTVNGNILSNTVQTQQLGVSGAVANYPNTSIRNTSLTGVSGTLYSDHLNVGKAFVGHMNTSVPAPYPANTFAIMGLSIPIVFGLDSTEVMRVHTDGNIGIGTVNPGYKLDVQGGGVNASAGYTQTSDIRLKTNIDYLHSDNALEKLISLRGIFYNWKDQEKLGSAREIGLIAQDVEKVFPEAIKKSPEGFLSVSYSNLISPVIESIKELHKRVIALFSVTAKHSRAIASIESANDDKDQKIKKLEDENAAMKVRLDKIEKLLNKSK